MATIDDELDSSQAVSVDFGAHGAYSGESDHRFQAIVNGRIQRISFHAKPLRDFMITREYEARERPSTVDLSVHDVLESVITLPWKP